LNNIYNIDDTCRVAGIGNVDLQSVKACFFGGKYKNIFFVDIKDSVFQASLITKAQILDFISFNC